MSTRRLLLSKVAYLKVAALSLPLVLLYQNCSEQTFSEVRVKASTSIDVIYISEGETKEIRIKVPYPVDERGFIDRSIEEPEEFQFSWSIRGAGGLNPADDLTPISGSLEARADARDMSFDLTAFGNEVYGDGEREYLLEFVDLATGEVAERMTKRVIVLDESDFIVKKSDIPRLQLRDAYCDANTTCVYEFKLNRVPTEELSFHWRTDDQVYSCNTQITSNCPPSPGGLAYAEPGIDYLPASGKAVFSTENPTVPAEIEKISASPTRIFLDVLPPCRFRGEIFDCAWLF